MELKYQYVLFIGIISMVALLLLGIIKSHKYSGGKKISGMFGIEETPYYKRRLIMYRVMILCLIATYMLSIAFSFLLIAKPYTTEVESEEKYNRDIILCLDISTSVDKLNMKLVDQLEETVKQLEGERFGIVIFNTSAVMLTPLTDDYEYVIEVLEKLRVALKDRIGGNTSDDWVQYSHYLFDGTLIGNEERKSSLIGDGLATAVYDFPNFTEDRTRIIIFSTDNDLAGDPYFTLSEAADLCAKKKVTVYGIGTKEMTSVNKAEMKAAMEKTGGKFYLEEEAGTIKSIVENIDKSGKNLIKGKVYVKEIPWVEVPFILLTVSFSMMIILTKLLKR